MVSIEHVKIRPEALFKVFRNRFVFGLPSMQRVKCIASTKSCPRQPTAVVSYLGTTKDMHMSLCNLSGSIVNAKKLATT